VEPKHTKNAKRGCEICGSEVPKNLEKWLWAPKGQKVLKSSLFCLVLCMFLEVPNNLEKWLWTPKGQKVLKSSLFDLVLCMFLEVAQFLKICGINPPPLRHK